MNKQQGEPLFTIFHFNDVYDIQPNKKGLGGIVNFEANIRRLKQIHKKNIVLFSGDCFSPSILSNIFKGAQMVHSLNTLKIDAACYGNHQFDFDPETSQKLAASCNFPWLLGNIKYKQTEFVLGNGIPYLIQEHHNIKIGIFGIAGEDWLGILGDQYQELLEYVQIGQHSRKMCHLLKNQQKCDMIIALTHMRVPQDKKLPNLCPDIDIILGGHDHIIMNEFINGIPVLKSGDNFKTIGVISVYKKDTKTQVKHKCKNFDFDIDIQQVPLAQEGNINIELRDYVDDCMEEYNKNDCIVGYTSVDLDIRFSIVRTKQTNYGNFLADLVKAYYDSDCCVINSGSLRNDLIIKKGVLTYSMISNIIDDLLVVKQVPGKILFQMLEYACSNLPNTYAGSFLLVSGIKYSYDYRKNPRVQQVWIGESELQLQRNYSVATKLYLSTGGDGFTMIRDCKQIIDKVSGINTLRLLLKFFQGSDSTLIQKKFSNKIQIQKQIKVSTQNNLYIDDQDKQVQRKISSDSKIPEEILKLSKKISVRQNRMYNIEHEYVEGPDDKKYISISPKVDGRIISLYP